MPSGTTILHNRQISGSLQGGSSLRPGVGTRRELLKTKADPDSVPTWNLAFHEIEGLTYVLQGEDLSQELLSRHAAIPEQLNCPLGMVTRNARHDGDSPQRESSR